MATAERIFKSLAIGIAIVSTGRVIEALQLAASIAGAN